MPKNNGFQKSSLKIEGFRGTNVNNAPASPTASAITCLLYATVFNSKIYKWSVITYRDINLTSSTKLGPVHK